MNALVTSRSARFHHEWLILSFASLNVVSFTVMQLPGRGWRVSGSNRDVGVGVGEEFGAGEQAEGLYNQAS